MRAENYFNDGNSRKKIEKKKKYFTFTMCVYENVQWMAKQKNSYNGGREQKWGGKERER